MATWRLTAAAWVEQRSPRVRPSSLGTTEKWTCVPLILPKNAALDRARTIRGAPSVASLLSSMSLPTRKCPRYVWADSARASMRSLFAADIATVAWPKCLGFIRSGALKAVRRDKAVPCCLCSQTGRNANCQEAGPRLQTAVLNLARFPVMEYERPQMIMLSPIGELPSCARYLVRNSESIYRNTPSLIDCSHVDGPEPSTSRFP